MSMAINYLSIMLLKIKLSGGIVINLPAVAFSKTVTMIKFVYRLWEIMIAFVVVLSSATIRVGQAATVHAPGGSMLLSV